MRYKLRWGLPRAAFWITFIMFLIVPLAGFSWFLFEFNMPFFNAGDKWLASSIIVMWWFASSVQIFGWKLQTKR
jgi:hypothetical protein